MKQLDDAVRDAVARLPGVESVSLARDLPLGGNEVQVQVPDGVQSSLLPSLDVASVKLVLDCDHYAKTRLIAHHVLIGFRGLFERKCLGHRTNSGHGAEAHRVFRVD